jgi:photosystem II stability/assembly factor-like uncharacterized protein
MSRHAFRTALAAAALALSAASTAQAFRDVLDTPAAASAAAPRGLLNGLARAGTRVVAVGQRGHIVYSDDAGRTWMQAKVPVSSDLVAVAFPSASLGWAVGHDGVILHSTDSGVTWSRQLDGRSPGQNAENPLLDVWFANERNGFAVGAFNQILHTSDGGRTWESWSDRSDNPKGLHLYAIRAVGDDLYIAGEQGLLLKLDGQAARFRALELPYKGTLFGITGSAKSLLVFGLRGNAFRSVDRGRSWQKVETGLQAGITAGATEAARMVLVSNAGHVLVSNDAGVSFRSVAIERPLPAAAVVAAGEGLVVIAGPRGVRTQPLN